MLHFKGITLYSTTLAHFWSVIKAGTGLGAGAVAAVDAAQFKHRENPSTVIRGNLGSLVEIIDKFALSLAS